MSGDRPEDLYQRLKQLEATVRGLTQELVESTERIRELEAALEEQETNDAENPTQPIPDQGDEQTNSQEAEETEDDIIVA